MATALETKRTAARDLLANGASRAAIARTLGVSESTVRRWLPSDPNARPSQAADPAETKAMRRMREQGISDAQIGRHFGISRAAVGHRLGPRADRQPSRGVRLSLDLSPETWAGVRKAAAGVGLKDASGGRPVGSIRLLLDAIASGEVTVAWATRPAED